MTITHAISTQRLVHVLQSIALKQQTGCLRVERVHSQEEGKGDIFFERGDTVFALTEQESGETALHTMLHWKHVSCTFQEGSHYTLPRTIHRQYISSPDMRRLSSMKAQQIRQTPAIGMPVIPRQPQSAQSAQSAQFPQSAVAIDMIETQLLPPCHQTDVVVLSPAPVTAPGNQVNFTFYDTGECQQVTGPIAQRVQIAQITGMDFSEEMGVNSIFRSLPVASYATTLSRLDRRDRVVLLLLNGKRTLRDVTLLVRRSEIETARAIVRLLKLGYVEYIGEK